MRKMPTQDISGDTHYTVLGISETATEYEIKRAYRRLIRQIHPDKFANASPFWKLASEKKSRELIEAYYVLSDSAQRASYDQYLAQKRQQHHPPLPPQPIAAKTSPPSSHTPSPSPRPHVRAGQKATEWALVDVLYFWMFCGTLLITAALLFTWFIDLFISFIELLRPS
jgi:curved DNA-binding protein CbpA